MTAKEYLSQAIKLDLQIENKKEILAKLREKSISIMATDYSKDKISSSSAGDERMFSNILRIVEIETSVKEEIAKQSLLFAEIINQIGMLEKAEEQLVLECKYILKMKWEDIAVKINYSISQTHRIHKSALENFIVPTIN